MNSVLFTGPLKFYISPTLPSAIQDDLRRLIQDHGGRVLDRSEKDEKHIRYIYLIDPRQYTQRASSTSEAVYISFTFIRACIEGSRVLSLEDMISSSCTPLFMQDNKPVPIFIHPSMHGASCNELKMTITKYGGCLVDNTQNAKIILVNDNKAKVYKTLKKNCAATEIYVEQATFTPEEETHLMAYIAKTVPFNEEGDRSTREIYQSLVDDTHQYPWAVTHSWKSWRDHYYAEQHRFDPAIQKYLDAHPHYRDQHATAHTHHHQALPPIKRPLSTGHPSQQTILLGKLAPSSSHILPKQENPNTHKPKNMLILSDLEEETAPESFPSDQRREKRSVNGIIVISSDEDMCHSGATENSESKQQLSHGLHFSNPGGPNDFSQTLTQRLESSSSLSSKDAHESSTQRIYSPPTKRRRVEERNGSSSISPRNPTLEIPGDGLSVTQMVEDGFQLAPPNDMIGGTSEEDIFGSPPVRIRVKSKFSRAKGFLQDAKSFHPKYSNDSM
ncbi:hypothetical protein BS47DRAFT_1362037 [Hydnum rufescens UP504]|uniref:DNA-binding protein RAP1 n=1 Tax=Hydnum rufescens UP504 TaxID=1448309 RepID=A0A9P6AYY8_9AGAM|nr:hypothetical protein BS47DRAFT_1362037 [Hydnum rufescens UP504]